jgi:hypothetical protein
MSKETISSAKQQAERVRQSPEDCSILPRHEKSLFLCQNDYWLIRYQGNTAFLKSTRGLRCLAVLLRNAGREFHVRELLAQPLDASTLSASVAMHGHAIVGLYAGVPVLDARAKAECRRRLTELRQDLNEAERFNDPHRKTQAQNEVLAISEYLASALGLGGRDRKTCSDIERARWAVTKRIRKAIKKIDDVIPSLGYHLATRIKTGYFCSYNPQPGRPVNWKF